MTASVHPDALLTEAEIVAGAVTGAEPVEVPGAGGEPVAVLEALIRPALRRAPCVVAFSGGRDSSLVLAVAVRLARREGLADPIVATLEFDSEATREREWQEIALRHLRIDDWLRLPQGDELDLVGPVASAALQRHGVYYPGNGHMVVPLAAHARGGTIVTGLGGDEVFGGWPLHDVASLAARRRAPAPRDLRRIMTFAAPRGVRTARYLTQNDWCVLPWLRTPLRGRVARRVAGEIGGSPRLWTRRMRWLARRRLWQVSIRTLDRLAADHGASTLSPLVDPRFLAALASAGGPLGWGDRTDTMRALFGELLPEPILSRRSKAEFSEPYFGAHTKRFAAEWDGRAGIDAGAVDAQALRSVWLGAHPHGLSAALLQHTWLQSRAAPLAAAAAEALR
jgi:asparagine synthase (glutamine-hydrolysing)